MADSNPADVLRQVRDHLRDLPERLSRMIGGHRHLGDFLASAMPGLERKPHHEGAGLYKATERLAGTIGGPFARLAQAMASAREIFSAITGFLDALEKFRSLLRPFVVSVVRRPDVRVQKPTIPAARRVRTARRQALPYRPPGALPAPATPARPPGLYPPAWQMPAPAGPPPVPVPAGSGYPMARRPPRRLPVRRGPPARVPPPVPARRLPLALPAPAQAASRKGTVVFGPPPARAVPVGPVRPLPASALPRPKKRRGPRRPRPSMPVPASVGQAWGLPALLGQAGGNPLQTLARALAPLEELIEVMEKLGPILSALGKGPAVGPAATSGKGREVVPGPGPRPFRERTGSGKGGAGGTLDEALAWARRIGEVVRIAAEFA